MMKVDFLKDFENVKKKYSDPNMEDFLDSGDKSSEECFKKAFVVAKLSGWDPVLITGPNGTGKSGYAQLLWNESVVMFKDIKTDLLENGVERRFMEALNCGAFSEKLIDSELFGYKKGTFTGADRDRDGKIVFAANSCHCLFLDEIGDLPMSAQVKLLRFFQQKEIQPIGADHSTKLGDDMKLKIICATNKNLDEEVEKGNFRLDLLARIRKYHITVPPLCERPNDCATNFRNYYNAYIKKQVANNGGVEPSWLKYLRIDEENFKEENEKRKYSWPENFRELQNRLNNAIVRKLMDQDDSPITYGDLFKDEVTRKVETLVLPNLSGTLPEFDLEECLDGLRQAYIEKAREQVGGVKTRMAKLLGYPNYQKMDRRLD